MYVIIGVIVDSERLYPRNVQSESVYPRTNTLTTSVLWHFLAYFKR
jgi:hypothetical protein